MQLYNRAFAFNHFGTTHEPLQFHGSERDFFESLILQIADSARMPFIAIREYDAAAAALRTLTLWEFGDDIDPRELDLNPLSHFPPFERALGGDTVIYSSLDVPECAALSEMPGISSVRSFMAVPITLADRSFGTLSIGSGCTYQFNSVESRALESLARAAGLAIQYFRLDHAIADQIRDLTEISVAITAVEIAHAARHEAVVKIANARQAAKNLANALGKGDMALASQRLDGLRQDHREIEESINKIKLAANPRRAEVQLVDIKDIWEEAKRATHGKLGLQRVNCRIQGAGRLVLCRPDHIRQVFLNLFLNSADAFETQGRRSRDRGVIVRIEPPATPHSRIVCTYRDTAGGLQTQLLRGQLAEADVPIERAIFQKGVTTKADGTGYGLWLAARFMQQHHGSIKVKSFRGGLMLELMLPHPNHVALHEDMA